MMLRLVALVLVILLPLVACWSSPSVSRRKLLEGVVSSGSMSGAIAFGLLPPVDAWAVAQLDVNNALAREYTAFPGLYPTIATKLVNAVKEKPFTSKKDIYAALDSEAQRERLRQYDASLVIRKPDANLQQFKTSQICKYECGSRVSNSYRDEQIRSVQKARR